MWNFLKPLNLGLSATSGANAQNRLAQTIPVDNGLISINKLYAYLYGQYTNGLSFAIYFDIYTSNEDGTPASLVASANVSSSSVSQSGWYEFDFPNVAANVTSGNLSFVMRQIGGDEENYVSLGYLDSNPVSAAKAFISKDATTWTLLEDVSFGIKVIETAFPIFDLVNHQINTPPPVETQLPVNLIDINNNATYTNTMLANSFALSHSSLFSLSNSSGKLVQLDNPDLLVSFVLDSSGSMGWNDRFSNRISFANTLANKLTNEYPKEVLFDVVGFGAYQINPAGAAQIGTVMSINLDARNPTRTTYIFTLSNTYSASTDSVYTNNDNNFIVLNDSNGITLNCIGTKPPLDVGVLTRVSGTGDNQVYYGAYKALSVDNSTFIATGFKSLKEAHTYNFGGISVGSDAGEIGLVSANSQNWRLFFPAPESPSMVFGQNGPNFAVTLDVVASANVVVRNPISSSLIDYANVTNTITVGSNVAVISSTNAFSIGTIVDFVDGTFTSYAHTVTNVLTETNTLVFNPVSVFTIDNQVLDNGIVQTSSVYSPYTFFGTTIKLLVRDVETQSGDIATFFLQTTDGFMIEWDFSPFVQWYFYNFTWLGDTATYNVVLNDINGAALPDGTIVEFEVDSSNSPTSATISSPSSDLTRVANVGSYTVYVTSTTNFKPSEVVNLIDNKHLQVDTIDSLFTDGHEYWLTLVNPLQYTFDPANGAKIVVPNNTQQTAADDLQAAISLSLINATTIFANAYASNVSNYDPPQIPPNTSYDELNFMQLQISNENLDVPTIGGNAVLRVLPITEDVVKSIVQEDEEIQALLKLNPPTKYSSQMEQNTGDLASVASTNNLTTGVVIGLDYTIQSPVFLLHGTASSNMTSTTIVFEEHTFDGLILPGVPIGTPIETRGYTIYPSVLSQANGNAPAMQQYLPSFDSYFTPQYFISSRGDGQQVYYWIPIFDTKCADIFGHADFFGYTKTNFDGVYVSSGNSYTINYTVTNKFTLMQSGQLHIRIYSNTSHPMEDFATNMKVSNVRTNLAINVVLPDSTSVVNGQTVITPQYSNIDAWRIAVANNPKSNYIQDFNANQIINDPAANNDPTGLLASIPGLNTVVQANTKNVFAPNPKTVFYTNPLEWTKASQLPFSEAFIDIVNGHATLTLEAIEQPAIFFVEASFVFGSIYETVRGDMVFFANPLNVAPLSPEKITQVLDIDPATGAAPQYEVSTSITWMGEPIAISTQVDFGAGNPSVSVTENGIAGGIMVHSPEGVMYQPPDNGLDPSWCPKEYDEPFTIKVASVLGYTYTCTRYVVWGALPGEDENNGAYVNFFFYINGNIFITADGSSATIPVDLGDAFNPTDVAYLSPGCGGQRYWIGEEGCNSLQENHGLIFVNGSILTPNKQYFNGPVANFSTLPVNQNIGFPLTLDIDVNHLNLPPWYQSLDASISYVDSSGKAQYGIASSNSQGPACIQELDGSYTLYIYPPYITYTEPLGTTISLETINGDFFRDGNVAANVVADVTWNDSFIKNTFTLNAGTPQETIINYPFPVVTFVAGLGSIGNFVPDPINPLGSDLVDTRAPSGAFLVVDPQADISLSTYATQVGLFRTSIYSNGISDVHTHACTVDDTGNGTTTSTIQLATISIANHSHVITAFIVDTTLGHTHTLRSVAITTLQPTTNQNMDISINAYVPYDPTGALPNPSNTSYYPYPAGINRLMYDTLIIPLEVPTSPILTLAVETKNQFDPLTDNVPITNTVQSLVAPVYYASESAGDTTKGFDVRAYAYMSAYQTWDSNTRSWVQHAAVPVQDGSRVCFDVKAYLPQSSTTPSTNNVVVVSPDVTREYLLLDITATASVAANSAANVTAQTIQGKFSVQIASLLQWLPSVKELLTEPTNSISQVQNAFTKINSLGASQVYDGVILAAQRLIDFKSKNADVQNYNAAIVLLSDYDENSSQYSLTQACEAILAAARTQPSPLICIKLGGGYTANTIIMQKLATCGNGITEGMINASNNTVNSLVDAVVTNEKTGFNTGFYTVILSTDQIGLPISATLAGTVTIPAGASLKYQVRTSQDGITWSGWSVWVSSDQSFSISQTLDSLAKYYEYNVKFVGNSSFQSPTISQGLVLNYYKAQDTLIFFEPVTISTNELEYVSSAFFTTQSEFPKTSTMEFGFTQNNSTDPAEYFINKKTFLANRQEFLMSRYNEVMRTKNYKTYTALNGRWPVSAPISVYQVLSDGGASLVDPSFYISNPQTGTISFITQQNKTASFLLCVTFDASFRFLCKVTNYGQETAKIDNLSLIYNIMKRIPVGENGKALNQSIARRMP